MLATLLICAGALPQEDPRLTRDATLRTARPAAEILALQEATRTGVLTHAEDGVVELLDFSDPEAPVSKGLLVLDVKPQEELTSVAVHPEHPWFLVCVEGARRHDRGRIQVHSLEDGRRLRSFTAGFGPDCISISRDGRHALVANEGEEALRQEGRVLSQAGSLTWLALSEDTAEIRSRSIPLVAGRVEGAVSPSDGRFLEREVEGRVVRLPLDGKSSHLLEPEVVTFDPEGKLAFCTLQENNIVCVVDVAGARVVRYIGLGKTRHAADLVEDGEYRPDETLVALREPDGIAVLPGGALFVTADEGDTEPNAGETPTGLPAGGGRTVSVFSVATGECVGDTENQLDDWAAKAGIYPDHRSANKGSEPEMITAFALDGRAYAAVGLERAGAVALIDLSAPTSPRVGSLCAVGDNPHASAPEGIVHFFDVEREKHYLFTANEADGTLSVLRID